jgi:glycerophosphoryl diester phosphodiesterase
MDAINQPNADLVTLSSHRGLHALVDGSYPRVPENSLQAIGLAAQAGLEMVEVDVKLTSDGVPILSHDTTWGRETRDPRLPQSFDPLAVKTPANEFRNPAVNT